MKLTNNPLVRSALIWVPNAAAGIFFLTLFALQ